METAADLYAWISAARCCTSDEFRLRRGEATEFDRIPSISSFDMIAEPLVFPSTGYGSELIGSIIIVSLLYSFGLFGSPKAGTKSWQGGKWQ